ncbi:HNH endonuclease, partial [Lamprobacter sp.]
WCYSRSRFPFRSTSSAEHGADTTENVVALCPNCHRKRHHG